MLFCFSQDAAELSARETNLFFERMTEKTGITFQFREYSSYSEWQGRKKAILEGEDLPDVLFKAELSSAEVRDLYQNGYLIDLKKQHAHRFDEYYETYTKKYKL